jgi:hypothetical protein
VRENGGGGRRWKLAAGVEPARTRGPFENVRPGSLQIHLYIGSRLIIAIQIRVFVQMNYPYFTNIPLNRIAVDRWLTAIQIRGYSQKIFQGVFRKYSRPAPEQPNETVPPTATPADPRATLLIYPPASASLASRALRWRPSSFAGAAAAPRQSPAETVTAPRGRRGGCSFVASEEALVSASHDKSGPLRIFPS